MSPGKSRLAHGVATLATSTIVLAVAAGLPGPVAAAAGNSSNIVYQVHPIVIQDTAASAVPTQFPSPSTCVAQDGLACYTPQILHQAYNIPWTINGQWAGTGEQVAIIDAYGSPTVASDLATYSAEFGLPAADLHVYYPQGAPTYNPLQNGGNETGWAEETSLDVQTVHGLAPGATINLVVAPSSYGNALNVAEQYAVTNHLGAVMSMSFGSDEAAIAGGGNNLQLQQAEAIYQQAAALGITVFASSGDGGASDGYPVANALFPASDPLVTAVGGTDLFVSAVGAKGKGSGSYAYQSETAWNDTDPSLCPFGCAYGPFGATGGAPSVVFPAPTYQAGVTGKTMRTTSDVAFNASVYTATMIYLGFLGGSNNGFYFFGGTSEGAPSWAAITADLDQARASQGGSPLGQLNPTLYGLATNVKSYSAAFHDVTVGNNQDPYPAGPGFLAGKGYDLPTGLGTPNVTGLLRWLAPGASSSFQVPQ
ncbi:MAG: S53 family peptidase [Candidatus Limnocylindrales bacterium]